MLRTTRRALALILLMLTGWGVPLAQAQDKTLRIVVPFGPGGGSDNFARILQPRPGKLAVTSPRRMNELPQVGTVAEAGFLGFESWIAQAVFAPQGTPPETLRRLNQAIATVLRQNEVREQLRAQALEPFDNTPEEFAAWVKKQSTQWARVIRDGVIQPD